MISRRVYETAEGWLKKRDDLLEEERSALLNYIKPMKNVEALATARWFANEVIRVPEDQPKVNEAIKVAKRAKVDPLTYSSPMSILNTFKQYKIKEKAIDPDIVPELSNGRTVGLPSFSIRVYDVEDTKKGQLAMRKIINTHWGEDANPWCVLQGDGEGNLSEHAWEYWNCYNEIPKRVAFKDGKLLAFCANVDDSDCWWDRKDTPSDGISFDMKMPNDELGREATYEMSSDGTLGAPTDMHRGNKQNGMYEEWHDNGQIKVRENRKNGKLEGLREEWNEDGQLKVRENYNNGKLEGLREERFGNRQKVRENYKNGQLDGIYEWWYENGQLKFRQNYNDGMLEGVQEEWFDNGQLKFRENRKNWLLDGLLEEWYANGQLKVRQNYNDGMLEGVQEEWFDNGQLRFRGNCKSGQLDGLREIWYESGQIKKKENFQNGKLDGVSEEWYNNGQLRDRSNWKNGKRDGLLEGWYANGQLWQRINYKNGERDGLLEAWRPDGQIVLRANYKEDKIHGLVEMLNEDGSVTRSIYNNGELQQEKSTKSFIKMGNEQRTIIAPRESKICMKA